MLSIRLDNFLNLSLTDILVLAETEFEYCYFFSMIMEINTFKFLME